MKKGYAHGYVESEWDEFDPMPEAHERGFIPNSIKDEFYYDPIAGDLRSKEKKTFSQITREYFR